MTELLVVQLGAPLAAFGNVAGNVERKTLDRPTRSALLGIAGAALGVERQDLAACTALGASFSTATMTIDPGRLLRDFHTYESVWQSRETYPTRADALARGARNTSITRRDYRTGGVWLAAYTLRDGAVWRLEALRDAFLAPVFTLYLGRKSCSLSLPLAPEIVTGGDAVVALLAYGRKQGHPSGKFVATDDPALLPNKDGRLLTRTTLQDDPRDRRSWQFGARTEYLQGIAEVEAAP